jgi:hypothetical protein
MMSIAKVESNFNPRTRTGSYKGLFQLSDYEFKNTDTIPARFSEKNAADDKLITLAYTFKTLSNEEWRAIYEALRDKPTGAAFNEDIGVKLPVDVALQPVPPDLANNVPQTKGYYYAVTHDRVLLVSPVNRTIVGVFAEDKAR